jgi:hypothetical protein
MNSGLILKIIQELLPLLIQLLAGQGKQATFADVEPFVNAVVRAGEKHAAETGQQHDNILAQAIKPQIEAHFNQLTAGQYSDDGELEESGEEHE